MENSSVALRTKSTYEESHDFFRQVFTDDFHFGLFDSESGSDLAKATTSLTKHVCLGLQVEDKDKVLDLGCGTGKPLLDICELTGARGVGVTLSSPGAQQGQDSAVLRNLGSSVQFVCADFMSEMFKPPGITKLIAIESFHLLSHKKEALRKMVDLVAQSEGSGPQIAVVDFFLGKAFASARDPHVLRAFRDVRAIFGPATLMPSAHVVDEFSRLSRMARTQDLTRVCEPTLQHWISRADVKDGSNESFLRGCRSLKFLLASDFVSYEVIYA